jgi:hypothetical protein
MARRTELAWFVVLSSLAVLAAGCEPEIDPVESARYEATGKAALREQEGRIYPDGYTPAPGAPRAEMSNGVYTTYFTPVATAASVSDALADGIVTREEFDAATGRMIACMDAQGVEHSQPVYDEGRRQYAFTIVAKEGSQPGLTVYDECWMKYAQDVTAGWVSQNHGQAPLNEPATLDCAREIGIVVGSGRELEALYYGAGLGEKAMEAARCIELMYRNP